MRETFIERRFSAGSLNAIEEANNIIAEYQGAGFTLTLRQLYYQFVARGLIANKQSEYKRLGSIINDGRLAGLIDWGAIEDRTRQLHRLTHWNDPEELIRAAAEQYREDIWAEQKKYVEVWVEKDALLGVIEPVCERWRVPYFACRGYASQSAHYEAGKRILRDAERNQRRTLILHLGDHDPSGIDMTRDNDARLKMFSDCGLGSIVDVKRIALNFDQVEQYNPPPNPAKETDSRSDAYIREYGKSSWELDALDPTVIDRLIDDEITAVIDMRKWRRAKAEENANRERINLAAAWLEDHPPL
jgi:hypothetical protein